MDEPLQRERCPDCGGIKMGPIFWSDEAPKDEKICRRGRVVFSGEILDDFYTCDGVRVPRITLTIRKPERR